MSDFETWTVQNLRAYLIDRGVTVTDYKRQQLTKLAKCVREISLPVDPDSRTENTVEYVHNKLADLGIDNDPIQDSGFCNEIDFDLDFSLFDVFNYLVDSCSDYDRRKLKGYKAFDEYRLYADGYVTQLELKRVDTQQVVFRAAVKPTQKDRTHLKTTEYKLWLVIDATKGCVSAAFCQCIGG